MPHLHRFKVARTLTEQYLFAMKTDWQSLLPPIRGVLPGGAPLRRTEPSGRPDARILILGVYPAATRVGRQTVGGVPMVLPVEVEAESFDPASASGAEINENYLAPLGLSRLDVLITDLVPYFLANTSVSSSGRCMADNIRLYEAAAAATTGIGPRPPGEELIQLARSLPGNIDRLTEVFQRSRPSLLLTLGVEPAAFVRELAFRPASRDVDRLLYAAPVDVEVCGVRTTVVHLVHPHLFIKQDAKWTGRHRDWCAGQGRELAQVARGSKRP